MTSHGPGESRRTAPPAPTERRAGEVVPIKPPPIVRQHELDQDERARSILLKSSSRQELFAKLTSGDPLRLVERASARIRQRHFLMEGHRLAQRAAVVVATVPYTAADNLSDWTNVRLDEAIQDVLNEDRVRQTDPAAYNDEDYEFMLLTFGIVPERAIAATVRFNGLNEPTRRSFFELLVYHKSIAECLESGLGPLEVLRYRCQLAVYSLLQTKPKRVDLSVNLDPIP